MLKQEDLAAITKVAVPSIRHMQAHSYTPWDDAEFEAQKHRRYNTAHALALMVANMLRMMGLSLPVACEVVNNQFHVIGNFLDKIEAGEDCPPLMIARIGYLEEDSVVGLRPMTNFNVGAGTEEEVFARFQKLFFSVGTTEKSDTRNRTMRQVSGPFCSIVSLPEAYRSLCLAAKAAGFVVNGRDTARIEDDKAE